MPVDKGVSESLSPSREVQLRAIKRRLKHALAKAARRRQGMVKTFHGVIAMRMVRDADYLVTPDVVVQQWKRRSPYTARAICLGMHLPTLARKAVQYGRTMLCLREDFSTQACANCGHCEHRGGALLVQCTQCSYKSHRDWGSAPTSIAKRAFVHGHEALRALKQRSG
jgi:transposase